jgi:hypothetical protein
VNLTPEQYSEMIIAKFYKVQNHYNLVKAIASVSSKYAKWTITTVDRNLWAVANDEHAKYVEEKQHEAITKQRAYRLALDTLVAKLPKVEN